MTTIQNVEVTDAKGSLPVCVTYHVTISYYVNAVSIMPMLNLSRATRPHRKGVFAEVETALQSEIIHNFKNVYSRLIGEEL